jgi:pimeloyl-ACP methyl ester carboxylesterase
MRRLAHAGLALALALVTGCGRTAAPQAATALGGMRAHDLTELESTFERALALADLDHSGGLSAAEAGLTGAQFDALDRNGDGSLTRAEFFAQVPSAIVGMHLPAFQPLVTKAFQALDANRNGRVSLGEAGLGSDRGPITLRSSFLKAAKDETRGLDAGEFRQFYLAIGGAEDLQTKTLYTGIGQSLLGGYLWLTGNLAAEKAIHPPRDKVNQTPRDFGFDYEDATLKAADGTPIAAWYIPAAAPSAKTIVLVHGYQCNRLLWLRQKVVPMLHDTYNLVLIDLRNHGASGGHVTTFSTLERLDVLAGIAEAKRRGAESIGVIGQSLGASSSINAVAEAPEVKALVEDCAFATVFSAFTGAISSTWVPQPALIAATALQLANQKLGLDMTAHEPITNIASIAPRPVTFIHGGQDPYIFPVNVQILSNAYPAPKDVWVCPGALHGDSDTTRPEEWKQHVRALFDRAL